MNKFWILLISSFLGLLLAHPTQAAFPEANDSSRLSGRILMDSASLGDLWYVNPADFHRYYVGTLNDAYSIIRNLSLGISNADFDKMASSAPDRLKGRFMIKAEDQGRAFYVDPKSDSFIYIENPQSALFLLRHLATTTNACVLRNIPMATLFTDDKGNETGREWQYIGWWGSVNQKYAPAMAEPRLKSKKLGAYSKINRLKVLAVVKGDSTTWYKVDGGIHPGAYVEAKFIDPIPQPLPAKGALLPKPIKDDEHWIDVDITRHVLTLFKGHEPVFATYVSTGVEKTPTIVGTFNIRYKFTKTRMHGAPPTATHYYDLKDVPWTMYYHDSYALHGAYWQDEFGGFRSSGCTNLTIGDAKFIFDIVGPRIGPKDEKVRFSKDNPGTIVHNHH
jgi:lipoprotein-anchoring transpeptidase ErfK/SrfK